MATALDFRALMAEERRRRAEERAKAQEAQKAGYPGVSIPTALQTEAAAAAAASAALPLPQWWQSWLDDFSALAPRAPLDLSTFSVCSERLRGVYYVPDFFSHVEAADHLARLGTMPEDAWVNLRRRRLQNHGGTPHADGMMPERIPLFIKAVMDATVSAGLFDAEQPPNHVLLNEYKRGQGIMPHQDGPLYQPLVAILSLGGPAMLQFWPSLDATKSGEPTASVLCLPNSLLVFREDAYLTHWHGIVEADADIVAEHTGNVATLGAVGFGDKGCRVPRGERRISLTVRRVLKVKDAESRLLTQEALAEEKRKQRWWLTTRGEEDTIVQTS